MFTILCRLAPRDRSLPRPQPATQCQRMQAQPAGGGTGALPLATGTVPIVKLPQSRLITVPVDRGRTPQLLYMSVCLLVSERITEIKVFRTVESVDRSCCNSTQPKAHHAPYCASLPRPRLLGSRQRWLRRDRGPISSPPTPTPRHVAVSPQTY